MVKGHRHVAASGCNGKLAEKCTNTLLSCHFREYIARNQKIIDKMNETLGMLLQAPITEEDKTVICEALDKIVQVTDVLSQLALKQYNELRRGPNVDNINILKIVSPKKLRVF